MATLSATEQTAAIDQTWAQVAGLRPSLGEDVQRYQHEYRGQDWLILADQRTEKYFRLSTDSELFLDCLNGQQTVEQIYQAMESSPVAALSREDIILLLGNLQAAGLLQLGNDEPTANNKTSGFSLSALSKPFAIRIPLLDPERFLQRFVPYFHWLPGWLVLWSWLGLVAFALVASWLNWSGLLEHGAARFDDPVNLIHFWLLYPLVKALHELAHAFATKLWGGVVHEMGIMLLVFFPVPYVDSSAANRFSSRRQRILVSAAGIMMETFLAALAMLVWLHSEAGLVRDLAFDIMIIGGISTLLFNANPLLRFDGYYIFSELIQIPNLYTRAQQYLGYLFQRYLLNISDKPSPVTAAGEGKWFFFYGLAAGFYRIFIALFIALWVAGQFLIIGLLLALWALIYQLLIPTIKSLAKLFNIARSKQRLLRLSVILGITLSILVYALTVPVHNSTYSQGIVMLPDDAPVRSNASGIVKQVHVADGSLVSAGQVVVSLENIELDTRLAIAQARLAEAQSKLDSVMLKDRTQSEIMKNRVNSLQAEVDDIASQLDGLNIRSGRDGRIVLPRAVDLPGRFIERGEVVGYSISQEPLSARVVVDQPVIDRVRQDSASIQLRLNSNPDRIYPAQMSRQIPLLSDRLPSRFLGSGAGGEVAIDTRDASGLQAIDRVYQVDIILPDELQTALVGQRVHLRFIHSDQSLGRELVNYLRQLWVQELA
ncbi:MAG: biotin/lipoyl-binding protein [Gammaproteobacteria bacterium]|nr:biotin/lipoyl-binding protein [Gammaproteobacteria bacterium]